MKVVFFGSSKYVLPILEVVKKNFDLTLVITTEKLETEPVISYCKTHEIAYLPVQQFNPAKRDPALRDNSTIQQLQSVNASLGVLAHFGLILPKEILSLFPHGILNVHPSLLPKYRGPTPGQTAILNGDTKTGVTIIKLDEEVDHGPILVQVEASILPTDTAETLYERLFLKGAELLSQNINKYIKDELKGTSQDHTQATFTKHLSRQDGFFDLSKPPAPDQLDRMIRAYHPWPGVWGKFKVQSEKLKVVKFLPGQKIQVEGGKPMSYKDFINGYQQAKELLERLGLWGG